MTLTTHALTGAAVATLFPAHPVAGFAAAFASHLVLDAIPHWDYKLKSLRNAHDFRTVDMPVSPEFWKDLMKIACDCTLGFALGLLLFGHTVPAAIAAIIGAAGGVAPDALHFVYFKFKKEPLASFQKFHSGIQRDRRLQQRPVAGILAQLLILGAIVGIHFWLAGRLWT